MKRYRTIGETVYKLSYPFRITGTKLLGTAMSDNLTVRDYIGIICNRQGFADIV